MSAPKGSRLGFSDGAARQPAWRRKAAGRIGIKLKVDGAARQPVSRRRKAARVSILWSKVISILPTLSDTTN